MKKKMARMQLKTVELAQKVIRHKSQGIDGILVTVGLHYSINSLCGDERQSDRFHRDNCNSNAE